MERLPLFIEMTESVLGLERRETPLLQSICNAQVLPNTLGVHISTLKMEKIIL